MKKCNVCAEFSDVNNYYNRDNTCKPCRREKVRLNRAKNIEYYREYDKWRYVNHPQVREGNKRYDQSDRGKVSIARAGERYRAKNKEARAAHIIVGNAVRDGKLIKPKQCPVCLEFKPSRQIHGHHDDYTKPMEVRWMCAMCHTIEHERQSKY